MEGVTKWDYGYSKASTDVNHSDIHTRLPRYPGRETKGREIISIAPSSQAGSLHKRIQEPKAKEGLSKTRLKHCTNEEEAPWTTAERQQIHATVDILKDDIRRARKKCKKMYALYSKLLNDIAEAKSAAKKIMHNYEREKKARELLEDLCIAQAKELEANKAEIKELRIQCSAIQQEMAEERRMLQMAEAWREERAQMKLVDAKCILEDKYSQMNNLIADLKAFLGSSDSTKDANEMSNAEF